MTFQVLTVFYFVFFFAGTKLYFDICYSVMDKPRFSKKALIITAFINTIIFTLVTISPNTNPSITYLLLLACSIIELSILFKNNIFGILMYSFLMLIVIVCVQSITIATGFLIIDANLAEVFSNHLFLFLLIDISWLVVLVLTFCVYKFVPGKYLKIIHQNKEQVLFILGFLMLAIVYLTLNSFIYANASSYDSGYIFIHQIITPLTWLGVVFLAIGLLIRFDYLHGYKVKSEVLQKTLDEQNFELIETKYKAEKDSLVEAYNRITAESKIEKAIQESENGVLFILDIDNFKGINDTKGHPFGDKVLKYLTKRISSVFREDDIIGRLGGDEFVVFQKSAPSIDQVREKAESLCKDINVPFSDKKGETVSVSISIGIARMNQGGGDFKTLYKRADAALYDSKRNGKNTFTFY